MNKEFKTPPPFVRCDECEGTAYKSNSNLELPCPKCAYSPLPGWLPRWYTPEQWIEYVRRENDMPNYELPDDMPVWFRVDDGPWFKLSLKGAHRLHDDSIAVYRIIATDAGRPPEPIRRNFL